MKPKNPTKNETSFVKTAAQYLEKPSLAVQMTNLIGKPVAAGIAMLPSGAQETIATVSRSALENALSASIATIPSGTNGSFDSGVKASYWTDWKHTVLTMATGAAGGFFGFAALPIELPLTTGIMLRSIASIADDFGHDLSSHTTRLDCLSVFAMGSPSDKDDNLESAYFASRLAMAEVIQNAAKWLAQKTSEEIAQAIAEKSAPALISFIAKIAARFEVVITEKAMAEAIPGIGAVTGASINGAFSDHFNAVARFHFGLRALEEKHGAEAIRSLYDKFNPSRSIKHNLKRSA